WSWPSARYLDRDGCGEKLPDQDSTIRSIRDTSSAGRGPPRSWRGIPGDRIERGWAGYRVFRACTPIPNGRFALVAERESAVIRSLHPDPACPVSSRAVAGAGWRTPSPRRGNGVG